MQRFSPDDARITIEHDGSGRLHVRWTGAAFNEVRVSFRASFPRHGDAVWLPDDRCWSVPAYLRPRLERWLGQTVEPASVTRAGRSDTDVPQEPRTPATVAHAYAALHLRPSAPTEVVEAAHRALVKMHHPDRGGDHAAACAINQAIALIRGQGEGQTA